MRFCGNVRKFLATGRSVAVMSIKTRFGWLLDSVGKLPDHLKPLITA
jgi:hypothetical protein